MIVDIAYDVRPTAATERTRRVHEMFGLGEAPRAVVVFDRFEIDPQPGQVILVTGPSGSGKSSLVRHLAERLPGVLDLGDIAFPADRALVDAMDCPLEKALACLSYAGLAEAFLLLRSWDQLSDGQRYRANLAKATSGEAQWLVADEFCANLDRTLAKVIAYNVRRVADRTGTGFLLATTHTDFIEDLEPDVHVEKGFGPEATVTVATPTDHVPKKVPGTFSIAVETEEDCRPAADAAGASPADGTPKKVPGTFFRGRRAISLARRVTVRQADDVGVWRRFAPFHYKSHSIGIVDRVFVMELAGEPIGIAALGYPTGALRLRNRVTGGRYSGGRLTRGRRLRLLNREVRTITRVVLRPEFRGCGLASQLVRYVLEHAGVPCVEALAAMGQVSRFFERAGMTRIGKVRRSALCQRLATLFLLAGATQSDLCDPDRLATIYEQADVSRQAALDRELARFFAAMFGKEGRKRSSDGLAPDQRSRALRKAAASMTAEPVYYFWARSRTGTGKDHNDTTSTKNTTSDTDH